MKNSNTQKGITLVVLIITIIILVILAVVSINAITGDGIIVHAKNARSEYGNAHVNEGAILQDYVDEIENTFLSEQEIFDKEFKKWEKEYLAENNNKMPEIFQYGDYEYRYNQYRYSSTRWYSNPKQNGWGVSVIDRTKESYGIILTNAFEKTVNTMTNTFSYCGSLISLPAGFTIPSSVTDMEKTFSYCRSLTGTININTTPTLYDDCFAGTEKTITLTTTSENVTREILEAIAATSSSGNVEVSI